MKKAFKIFGLSLLTIIILLIAIPFAFQGQISDMVKELINNKLNAKVEFSDVSLSFLKSFPQAHVSVSDLTIVNFKPFENETLASIKDISFTLSVKELLKNANEDPIIVNRIYVNEALLSLKTDKFGNTNYDIVKEDKNKVSTEIESESFKFDIEDYSIKRSAFIYIDETSRTTMSLTELSHEGHGIFSADKSELDTKSEVNLSFSIDSTSYLTNNPIKLDALIGLDLENNTYTFKDNKAFINKLPIEFNGFVQLIDEGQNIDITFKNPETSFKNFLAIIPEAYSKNIDEVETSGDFKVEGTVKGTYAATSIPKLDINITSNNASFKYPDLPKGVENITINTAIKNTTGHIDDTYIDINTLNFKIDEDIFKSSATLKNITKNILVQANIDGVLNLSNLTKAYPIALENTLTGILKAKLNTSFDMNALETNNFERIKNSGSASISNFVFSSEDIVNPIHISEANMTFNPKTVLLNNFKARTGNSDLNATGTIQNLLGFLLSDGKLRGNFNVTSQLFKVSDFMTEDETTVNSNKTTTDSESLKIPSFLDCKINADAATVVYDNLNLKNLKGELLIKDQQAILNNMTSNLFDGVLTITGNVSTKDKTPIFDMTIGANEFDIEKSFNDLELLQNLAPIAKVLQGKINTTLNFSGELDENFAPNLSSISGDALAEVLTSKLNANQGELFNQLESSFNFIDFDKLDLKDLKTKLEFTNGKVSIKPFDLKYEDISITVSGSHGFDKTIAYHTIFDVPAKYLGSDVNRLIGKIDSDDTKNITIPVTANIQGTYTSPSIKTDLTSGISNLTKQLIEIEKQKLLNQGKDKVKNLIGDVIGNNKSKTDSAKQKQNKAIENVLNDVLGNKKNTNDNDASNKNNTANTVKNVLGGLFSNKKKENDSLKSN